MDLNEARELQRATRLRRRPGGYREIGGHHPGPPTPMVMVEACPICRCDLATITTVWLPGIRSNGPKRLEKDRNVTMLYHLMEEH